MAGLPRRALVLALAAAAWAMPPAVVAADEPPAVLQSQLVKTGLYLITGGGANSLLRLSAQGLVLVDGKQAGSYRALMGQVRKINRMADLPLRLLVLTSPAPDHAGSIASFLAAGVPVLAQAQALGALPPMPAASGPKSAATVIPFDTAYRLVLGGAEVRLLHVGTARGGDSVVYFPDLKVVALGKLYTVGEPAGALAEGGSLATWGAALDQVLALDFDLAVPATGAPVDRAAVQALRARLPPAPTAPGGAAAR